MHGELKAEAAYLHQDHHKAPSFANARAYMMMEDGLMSKTLFFLPLQGVLCRTKEERVLSYLYSLKLLSLFLH